ncbi:hypothetical protein MCOR20_002792 [Pyricularia oryzae]|nr:hypothetical protein MCOR24_008332 [Pyricularia oryzae]KAI6413606.1 hypothetical protein MCOR20_002792 [Pyricularia oryzae]KAI6521581.1 hypothetical protein MCOR05_010534 [Pyricularia oryzae]
MDGPCFATTPSLVAAGMRSAYYDDEADDSQAAVGPLWESAEHQRIPEGGSSPAPQETSQYVVE